MPLEGAAGGGGGAVAQPPVERGPADVPPAVRAGPLRARRRPRRCRGQPWRPWTIPNAIGFIRLALIPVFLVLALSTEDGTDALPVVLFAVIGWTDYLDGIAARLTGQYSRLGTLLDPLVDRCWSSPASIVCWNFELLPRWALALLAVRELFVIVARALRPAPRRRR